MSKAVANSIQQGKKTSDENKLRQVKSQQKKRDERMGMEEDAKEGLGRFNRDSVDWHENSRNAIGVPRSVGPPQSS